MIMRTTAFLCITLLFFSACSKKEPVSPDDKPGDTTPFSEGTIEMGMYSHGVDLGYFIKNIDFSRNDVRDQFADLTQNSEEGREFAALLQEYSNANPFAALGLITNSVIATYYIKGEVVLGKARGFGYLFDNYHDVAADEGQLFLRSLVQTDEIPEEDRELSVSYVPSTDLGVGNGGAIELSMYDRQRLPDQEVAGYACNVSTYTLKTEHIPEPDPGNPLPQSPVCYKLVVYTSEAFDKTINFTHPFYLPEDAGILKLEVFYDQGEEPTLVMQPEKITPRTITDAELQIEEVQPVYDFNNTAIGWKMLAILFSGWGAIGD